MAAGAGAGAGRWAGLEWAAGAGAGALAGPAGGGPGSPPLAAAAAALVAAGGEPPPPAPGPRAQLGAARLVWAAASVRCTELRRGPGAGAGAWPGFFGGVVGPLVYLARERGGGGPTRLAVACADAALACALALVAEAEAKVEAEVAAVEAGPCGAASSEWMLDRYDASSEAAGLLRAAAPELGALLGLLRSWAQRAPAGGGAAGSGVRRALLARALEVAGQRVRRLGEERGAGTEGGVRQALLMCWGRWAPLLLADGAGFGRAAALSLSDCECRLLAAESQLEHAADEGSSPGKGDGPLYPSRAAAAVREYRVLSLVSLGLRLAKFSDSSANARDVGGGGGGGGGRLPAPGGGPECVGCAALGGPTPSGAGLRWGRVPAPGRGHRRAARR